MQSGMLSPPAVGRERSSSSPPGASKANRACEKCTRTKKKCDKGLPACSRCTRLATKCVYDFVLAPTAATMVEQSLLANFLGLGSEMRFDVLDPRSEVTAVHVHSVLTSQGIHWRDAVGKYFQTLHPWFSIVQSECLHRKLEPWQAKPSQSASTPGSSASSASGVALGDESLGGGRANPAEMALLFVCMHLATQWAETVENKAMLSSPTYLSAKRIFALLRSYSMPSVELVQCGLLLAVYEHGHGDVMRGYVSLSECVGMAHVLRVRPGKLDDETINIEDSEDEQLRALYWGLYVWDKISHSHFSTAHLPLLMDLPDSDDLLPIDNYLWDKASRRYFKVSIKASVSEPVSTPLGGFQRSCQAAVLVAKGLQWNLRGLADDAATVEGFADLDLGARRLIEAMVLQACRSDEFAESFAMCLSLLFILYSGYLLSIDPSRISPNTTDVNILKAIAGVNFAIRLVTDSTADLDSALEEDSFGSFSSSSNPPMSGYSTPNPNPQQNPGPQSYASPNRHPSVSYHTSPEYSFSYPNPPQSHQQPTYHTNQTHNSNNATASTPTSISSTPHRRVSAPSCAYAVLHAACSTHAFKNIIPDADTRLMLLRNALAFFSRRWAVADELSAELDAFVQGRRGMGFVGRAGSKRGLGIPSSAGTTPTASSAGTITPVRLQTRAPYRFNMDAIPNHTPTSTSTSSLRVRNISGVQVKLGDQPLEDDGHHHHPKLGRRDGRRSFVDEGYGSWERRRSPTAEYSHSPLGDYSPTSVDGGAWNGMDWSFNV